MKRAFTAVVLLAVGSLLLSAQQKPPAPDELKGLQEIVNATTVETRVAAVDNFVKAFPKSEYRGFALTMAADAYEAGGNITKAIIDAYNTKSGVPAPATPAANLPSTVPTAPKPAGTKPPSQ